VVPSRACCQTRVRRAAGLGSGYAWRVLVRLVAQFGYIAITGLLVAAGMGAPVPEELIQLTAGYLARRGVLLLGPAIVAAYLGIVAGDFLFFRFAQAHGPKLLASRKVSRVLTPARQAMLERHFARHAFLTIVVARHTSGLRLAAYALAATHGVRPVTFLLADAISAMLSVPLVVSLGYLFAAHIETVRRRVNQFELALALAVIAVAAAVVLVKWWRGRARPGEAGATRDR